MRESDLTIVRALESDSSNENTSEPFDKSLRNLSKIVRKQYSSSFFTTFSKILQIGFIRPFPKNTFLRLSKNRISCNKSRNNRKNIESFYFESSGGPKFWFQVGNFQWCIKSRGHRAKLMYLFGEKSGPEGYFLFFAKPLRSFQT